MPTRSIPTVSWRFERQFQFGAHAVGAGTPGTVLVLFGNINQTAEAANAAGSGAHGALGKRFDILDQAVAGVDIYAGVAVGEGVAIWVWDLFQVEFSLSSGYSAANFNKRIYPKCKLERFVALQWLAMPRRHCLAAYPVGTHSHALCCSGNSGLYLRPIGKQALRIRFRAA